MKEISVVENIQPLLPLRRKREVNLSRAKLFETAFLEIWRLAWVEEARHGTESEQISEQIGALARGNTTYGFNRLLASAMERKIIYKLASPLLRNRNSTNVCSGLF